MNGAVDSPAIRCVPRRFFEMISEKMFFFVHPNAIGEDDDEKMEREKINFKV